MTMSGSYFSPESSTWRCLVREANLLGYDFNAAQVYL